ncbi:alpha-L-fucosidase [Bradyrhizobium sp. USDA 4529]
MQKLLTCVGAALFMATLTELCSAADPKRNIVVSLDNHIAPPDEFNVDEATLRRSIQTMLVRIRPKRVMAFAVGHDGFAQYPSQVFSPIALNSDYPKLKGLPFDLLKVWKEETQKTGTQFFIYVSTLKNMALLRSKPEYFRKFINGSQATVIDHNSAYADEVLLPGLQELIDRYDPDGFFLDGDYWSIHESWNRASVDGFERATGQKAPTEYTDPDFPAFQKFTYDSYGHYVQKIADFFRRQKHSINWTINAAFTIRDPSPVPDNVGSITIDLPFFALVESHIESLFGLRLNRETEIVYPLFAQPEGGLAVQYKTEAQLAQEMAVAVAYHSMVHVYLPLGHNGEIPLSTIEPALNVYDKLDRYIGIDPSEPTNLAADVALVDDNADAIAARDFSGLRAASIALFESGIAHAIISDSQAAGSTFSHLIFPSMNYVEDRSQIRDLVGRGKKLLWVLDPGKADKHTMEIARSFEMSHDLQIVSQLTPEVLQSFVRDANQPVRFPNKPAYVFPLIYRGSGDLLTIYLSNVAWGGPELGRHAVFDKVPAAPGAALRFTSPYRCTQRTLSGTADLLPGTTVRANAFDIVSRLDCKPQ